MWLEQDNILMALRGEGMATDDNAGEGSAAQQPQDVVYVLHPNCAIEDV